MKKTKEELNGLKQECKEMGSKLRELSEDELDQVTGGRPELNNLLPILVAYGLVAANDVKVRSINGSNQPLYVVDGVIYDNTNNK